MNLHDEMAKVAYELYEKSGCIKGRDLDNWLDAEMIVLTKHASQEIEEPEASSIIEEIEMEGSIVAEEKGVTEEAKESEETTVVEEIEVKGTGVAAKGKTRGTEKIKPAKRAKTVKEGATKGEKGASKKLAGKGTKKTRPSAS